MSTIHERLRTARENAGLSQAQVARLLRLHRPTVSEIEAGRRRVSAEELAHFARTYDVSPTWLINGTPADTDVEDRVLLAARTLAKMSPTDLDNIMKLIKTMRRK
jgi:transcriptional regulator with XRE-family HTH domain